MICIMFTIMEIETFSRYILRGEVSDTDDTLNTEKDETQFVSLVSITGSSTNDDTSDSEEGVDNELKPVTNSHNSKCMSMMTTLIERIDILWTMDMIRLYYIGLDNNIQVGQYGFRICPTLVVNDDDWCITCDEQVRNKMAYSVKVLQ